MKLRLCKDEDGVAALEGRCMFLGSDAEIWGGLIRLDKIRSNLAILTLEDFNKPIGLE